MKRKFAYQKVYGSTNVHIIELCTKKAFDRECEFLLSPKHILVCLAIEVLGMN